MRRKVILAALFVAGVSSVPITARAQPQHSGHGFHPPMPGEKFIIQCRFNRDGEPAHIEVPLELLSPMRSGELAQVIELPKPYPPIHVKEILLRSVMEQAVAVDETGKGNPAIHLAIDGPTQSHQRWLLANDAERNRLTSFIGTWRYMSAENKEQRDTLFLQFQNELTRDASLLLSKPGGGPVVEMPAKEGHIQKLDQIGCAVRVRRFLPDFAFDKDTNKAVNQSDKRLNPAALVEIDYRGKKTEHWVFARHPDFMMKGHGPAPVQIKLDCPVESERPVPSFVVLSMGVAAHEVWLRHDGDTSARSLSIDEKIDIPDSQYAFRVARFVPSGRLEETYRPDDRRGTTTALKIQTTDASGKTKAIWLEAGKEHVIGTEHGAVSVAFNSRQSQPAGGHQ